MGYKDKNKQREYARLWVARRRADFFSNKSCVVCGSTERLELDHIDPSTKVSHNIWTWSQARRDEEIAKCQVLCYDCHLDKTVAFRKSEQGMRGTQVPSAKLTEQAVLEIKAKYSAGISGIKLAKEYGVDKTNIYRVLHGKAWTHCVWALLQKD